MTVCAKLPPNKFLEYRGRSPTSRAARGALGDFGALRCGARYSLGPGRATLRRQPGARPGLQGRSRRPLTAARRRRKFLSDLYDRIRKGLEREKKVKTLWSASCGPLLIAIAGG